MKRNGKIILLGLALALCLLLTGCYMAPDDVNNGGGTSTGNNLPFQTLQPTATVTFTPDTVAVVTPNTQGQNVFPSTPTATPAPGQSGSWNNWGSTDNPGATAGPTTVPTGGTIVFNNNTPEPGAANTIQTVSTSPSLAPTTAAPITPTPTPLTMRLGFQGEAVRTVQRRLKELGYYTGSIDGDFGVALLNDSKYGYRAKGGELSISLLRASTEPDPVADRGAHRFTYSILPHAGDLAHTDEVVAAAAELNQGVERFEGFAATGEGCALPEPLPVRLVGEGIDLAVLKKAEDSDDLVVRLVETRGRRATATLSAARHSSLVARHFAKATPVLANELEETGAPFALPAKLSFRPFEIKTLRLSR